MSTVKIIEPTEQQTETRSETSHRHQLLIDGFQGIDAAVRNVLAWVALDTKFERFVVAAIAATINSNGERIAHVEFSSGRSSEESGSKESRLDLVILERRIETRPRRNLNARSGSIARRYESKAGQLFDFAPAARTKLRYLGGELDEDLATLQPEDGAALFFLSEIGDPSRCLKYYAGHDTTIGAAIEILERNVTRGKLARHEVLDCGRVDGTSVKIHMVIFDRV